MIYASSSAGPWEGNRVGVGAPPLLTDHGWICFYHGADSGSRYTAGILLLNRDDPSSVLAASGEPVLTPQEPYEKKGFLSYHVTGRYIRAMDLIIFCAEHARF
ncbi:hypothetical protein ES705_22343 [subsurface metagenome]